MRTFASAERSREWSRELSREWTREWTPERKRRDARTLLACIAGVGLVVASLVLLVLVRMGDVQAGYELYSLQKRKVELTQERSALVLELAALKRPDRLARVGAELGLTPLRADRVLRVDDGTPDVAARDTDGGGAR